MNIGEWLGRGIRRLGIYNTSAYFVLVRMNFSHGSYEYHQSVVDNVRKVVESQYFSHDGLRSLTAFI